MTVKDSTKAARKTQTTRAAEPRATEQRYPPAGPSQPSAWKAGRAKPTPVKAAKPAPPPALLAAPESVDDLKRSLAWAALPGPMQRRIEAQLNAEGMMRIRTRLALGNTISEKGFKSLTPEQQVERFIKALNEPPAVPGLATDEIIRRPPPVSSTVSEGLDRPQYDFGQGIVADATEYVVNVDGVDVPVVIPKPEAMGEGMTHYTLTDVERALADMPSLARAQVAKVVLSPKPHGPIEAYEKVYGKGFQAFATCGADGIVTVYPRTVMPSTAILTSTMVHESGHAWSHTAWGHDHDGPEWKAWAKAIESDRSVPTEYAKKSLDEDLAETWVLYAESEGTPLFDLYRSMYPARFALLDEARKKGYMFGRNQVGPSALASGRAVAERIAAAPAERLAVAAALAAAEAAGGQAAPLEASPQVAPRVVAPFGEVANPVQPAPSVWPPVSEDDPLP